MEHYISDASTLDVEWQNASTGDGNCMDFARYGERVAVRQSKAPNGPALLFTRSELEDMLNGARAGAFDELTQP